MFVSFHGTNELRLGNVAYQDTLDEIKEHIIPMWPHGVSSQMTSPLSWRITFSRNPWSATGSDAIMSADLLYPTLDDTHPLTA